MADFTREEIEKAVKASRKFIGANLAGMDLSGADLIGADLIGADLSGAKYDKDTKFPEDFDPEAAGMVLEE